MIKTYLKSIIPLQPLTAAEEKTASKKRLIEGLLHLVVKLALEHRHLGLSADDLISVGNEALCEAAEAFDRARGLRFSTLAT